MIIRLLEKRDESRKSQLFEIDYDINTMYRERCYPLQDKASLLHFRAGLGYGSISFPIKPHL